jgi:cell wall-associated NlpC family hydrolase
VLNPAAATDAFYTALAGVPHWATLPPGAAAAAVQGTSHPERYAADEAAAAALVGRFWRGPDLPAPAAPRGADPEASADELAGVLVPPACPDPGGSDAPGPTGPLDRSRLPGDVGLPTDPTRRAAVRFALAQVGRPYVFGAKGPRAFDCSGLTQAAWAAAGVGISAGTLSQIHDGTPVASLADLAPGDLLFRPGSLGTPNRPRHVGLYAGDGVVVEAASRRTGVIVSPLAQWTATAVAIRRIAGPPAAGPPAAAGASAPPRPRPWSALAAGVGAGR